MAFAIALYRASKIEKLKKELEREKQASVAVASHKKRKIKFGSKHMYKHICGQCVNYITGLCCAVCCTFKKSSFLYKTLYKGKRYGTCENFTLKSILGFIGGFFMTYIFFMFFVLQLNFKLSTATIMCSIIGSILTLGLAFSYKIRCLVFLLLPQLFSKRGRQALIAYAFILAITGPAKNTLQNVGILSESMACGQEQLKFAVRQVVEVIKKPFYAIKDAIKSIIKSVKEIVLKLKEILLTIKRIVMSIIKIIKSAFQFLGKILNVCNKELGTPFVRCRKVFEDAIVDCNAKLGPLLSWLCSITYLVQSVCYIVKIFDYICLIVEFISDSIVGVVTRKIKIFIRHMRTMFFVRIKFSHSFHFESNQTKSFNDITSGIVTEIRQRTEKLLTVFDVMSCAASLFFIFIVLQVLHYRFKFLSSDRYDNKYITKYFRQIDMKRAQQEKETVLPLNHRERLLYVNVKSLRLLMVERVKLFKAIIILGITALKLTTHMMVDYALYWILTVIRYHARFQSNVPAPNTVMVHIDGQGFLAQLLQSIVKAFQPLGVTMEIDTIPCLPDPIPPDYDRYIQIASLLLLSFVLTILEPYGLRLRHSVMSYYHPTRAKQRAIWLYNHILRSRHSFLKFARRQLRRKVNGTKNVEKTTCIEYLRANAKWKFLRICLGSDKQDACILCGTVFREKDRNKPIRCSSPGCPGIYCQRCFKDLQNICTLCLDPVEYGDISDISEEKDSSDDSQHLTNNKVKRKRKRCTISKCCKKYNDDETERASLLHPEDSTLSKPSDLYYSSETSTDNSYEYQNFKNISSYNNIQLSSSNLKDIEKQHIRDYASWDVFQENFNGENSSRSAANSSSSHSSVLSFSEVKKITSIHNENSLTKYTKESETISLETTISNISGIDYENKSNDTETSFIQSLQSETQKQKTSLCRACKFKLKNYLKHTCKRRRVHIPRLNLNFHNNSSTSSDNSTSNNHLTKNIKFENVTENFEKSTFTSTTETNRNQNTSNSQQWQKNDLNIGYEIFVPRYDKFINCNDLLNISRLNKDSVENKKLYCQKMELMKREQRKNREDQIKSKANLRSSKNYPCERYSKGFKRQSNVQNKSNQFLDLFRVFKNIFKKKRKCDLHDSSKSKRVFKRSVSSINNSQLRKTTTSTENNSSRSISSDTLSKINVTDVESSSDTHSTYDTLMGNSVSHQRGGADVIWNNANATQIEKTEINIKTPNIVKNLHSSDSSDSELTDLDLILGKSKPRKIKSKNLNSKNNPKKYTEFSNFEEIEIENINKNSCPTLVTNNFDQMTDESNGRPLFTSRYSRQPAERDENPSGHDIRPMKFFASPEQNESNYNLNQNMYQNYSERSYNCPTITKIRKDSTFHDILPCHSVRQKFTGCKSCGLQHQAVRCNTCCSQNYYQVEESTRNESSTHHSKPHGRTKTTREYCNCCHSLTSIDNASCSRSQLPSEDFNLKNTTNAPVYTCGDDSNSEGCPCSIFKITGPEINAPNQEDGFCSECSESSEFPNLVYQNTDEFLDLVNELGETLSLRNKERVQKAIREFELNSRQNKNLEKPVFTDDSDDLSSVPKYEQPNCKITCDRCRKKKVCSAPPCPTKFTRISTRREHLGQSPPLNTSNFLPDNNCNPINCTRHNFQHNLSSSRWQLDKKSGEWYKVYKDYEYKNENYCPRLPTPLSSYQQCQCCRGSKCNTPKHSSEQRNRNCSHNVATCRCKNCGFLKE